MNVQMQRRSRVSFKGCRVSVKCSRVSLKAGGFGTDPASQQLLTRNASDNTEDDEISQVGENGPWSSDSEEDEQPSVRRFAGSAPPSSVGTGLFLGLPVRVCPSQSHCPTIPALLKLGQFALFYYKSRLLLACKWA